MGRAGDVVAQAQAEAPGIFVRQRGLMGQLGGLGPTDGVAIEAERVGGAPLGPRQLRLDQAVHGAEIVRAQLAPAAQPTVLRREVVAAVAVIRQRRQQQEGDAVGFDREAGSAGQVRQRRADQAPGRGEIPEQQGQLQPADQVVGAGDQIQRLQMGVLLRLAPDPVASHAGRRRRPAHQRGGEVDLHPAMLGRRPVAVADQPQMLLADAGHLGQPPPLPSRWMT